MKLYKIPKQSKIYTKCSDGSNHLMFHHIDGGYSYCVTEKGAVCHLSATQELEEYKDGYKLIH